MNFRQVEKIAFILLSMCVIQFFIMSCATRPEIINNVGRTDRAKSFVVKPGDRVAILTFSGSKGSALSELVSIALMRRDVNVIERDSLDRIVAEIKRTEQGMFNNSLSDSEVLKQIGKIANADVILYGDAQISDPNVVRLYDEGKMMTYRVGQIYTATIILFWIGVPMMAASNPYEDFGRLSPIYFLAYSRLSLRAFDVKTGEVVLWGTDETLCQNGKGDNIRLMDYLRVTARKSVDALMDPEISSIYLNLKNDEISRELHGN